MSLTIEQLRNFAGTGGISISAGIDNQQAEIKSTGFLHKIKTFLGFKSAKAQNAATIDAIRMAIQSDPRLFLARQRADELLDAVKGTITATKVRSIIADLDSTVGAMSGTEQRKAVNYIVNGCVAAAGMPKFAKGLGQDFAQYYCKMIAGTVADKMVPRNKVQDGLNVADISREIAACRKTIADCFKIIGDDPEDRQAFAKMVSDHRTLILMSSANNGVMKPSEDCLQIARDVKALFDKRREIAQTSGTITARLAMESITSMDTPISADLLGNLVEAGRKMDTSDLAKLGKHYRLGEIDEDKLDETALEERQAVMQDEINKALGNFIAKFNNVFRTLLKDMKGDVSRDMAMNLQELLVHNAIDAMDQDDKEGLAKVLSQFGQNTLADQGQNGRFMRIMKLPLEMATQIDIESQDDVPEEDLHDIIPNLVDNTHNVTDTDYLETIRSQRPLFDESQI